MHEMWRCAASGRAACAVAVFLAALQRNLLRRSQHDVRVLSTVAILVLAQHLVLTRSTENRLCCALPLQQTMKREASND